MTFLLLAAGVVAVLLLLISVLLGRRQSESPKILLLHSLQPRPIDFSSTSFQQFTALIDSIASAGFTCGTVEESLRDHTKVAITFDDGYDDLMSIAPILREKHLPITVFIPTVCIGKPNVWDNFLSAGKRRHLGSEQIKELAKLGVHFGSHGHTHRDLTTMPIPEAKAELNISRNILSELTGRDIVDLAYPFGRSSESLHHMGVELGFTRQFGSVPGGRNSAIIGRIPITKLDNAISVRAKLLGNAVCGVEMLKSLVISRFSYLTPVTRPTPRLR